MRKILLAIGVLVVACARGDAQDVKPADVVKKAIEAHGGAAALDKAKIARTTAKGTMNLSGQKIDYATTAVHALPDKYKLETTGELAKLKLVTSQVLNGKKTKIRATLAGADQPLPDKAKDETIQAALVQEASLLTPLQDAKKFTLKADKDADVNGSPATVLVVTGNGLKELKLFFDKKSNLLVKMQRKGLAPGTAGVVEVDEETFLSDFKKFDAALLPSKVVVTHDKKEFLTMVVTEWKFLDKVEATEFSVDD
ncbi:MAG: hypothetical protein KF873_10120 [Gemmataceae bacterium]|nr:hypothetical protein [Gemmataceae bacterium]